MKPLLTLGAALALSPALDAGVAYLRPEVAYFIPTDSEADSTVGVTFAGGYGFGDSARHELELELGWAEWDLSTTATGIGGAIDGTHKITPLLVNYRFSLELNEKVRWFVQAGVGFAESKIKWGDSRLGGYDDTGGAFSAGMGFRWHLAERTKFTVGYRYIALSTLEWRISSSPEGVEIMSNESDAHIVALGMQFSF